MLFSTKAYFKVRERYVALKGTIFAHLRIGRSQFVSPCKPSINVSRVWYCDLRLHNAIYRWRQIFRILAPVHNIMRLPRPILEEINFQGVVLRGFFLQLEFFLSFVVCVVVFLLLLLLTKDFRILWERLRPMSPRTHSLKALIYNYSSSTRKYAHSCKIGPFS